MHEVEVFLFTWNQSGSCNFLFGKRESNFGVCLLHFYGQLGHHDWKKRKFPWRIKLGWFLSTVT